MAGVKVSLNNGAASSPPFAGGNDNEKKKNPPRPYFIRSQALALGSDVFASASPRRAGCGGRGGGVKGQGRGVRATSVVPLRPSLLAEGVHTSVAGAMRSRAEGDCGGVAKCAPENSRHSQGPT